MQTSAYDFTVYIIILTHSSINRDAFGSTYSAFPSPNDHLIVSSFLHSRIHVVWLWVLVMRIYQIWWVFFSKTEAFVCFLCSSYLLMLKVLEFQRLFACMCPQNYAQNSARWFDKHFPCIWLYMYSIYVRIYTIMSTAHSFCTQPSAKKSAATHFLPMSWIHFAIAPRRQSHCLPPWFLLECLG